METNTQTATRNTVTLDDVFSGKKYTPRPGLEYELAPGIFAVMVKPTIDVVRRFDSVSYKFAKLTDEGQQLDEVINPDAEAYYVNSLVERTCICCQLPEQHKTPEGLLSLPGLTSKILRVIVNDFSALK